MDDRATGPPRPADQRPRGGRVTCQAAPTADGRPRGRQAKRPAGEVQYWAGARTRATAAAAAAASTACTRATTAEEAAEARMRAERDREQSARKINCRRVATADRSGGGRAHESDRSGSGGHLACESDHNGSSGRNAAHQTTREVADWWRSRLRVLGGPAWRPSWWRGRI